MFKKYFVCLFALSSFLFTSCINDEGLGGSASIEGTVYKVIHNDDIYSLKADTIPAAKEDVFIVYGDKTIYGDKMETANNGFFKFNNLIKGTYKVYAYTAYSDGRKEAVGDTLTVETGKTVNTKNIYIHSGKALGKSYIKGTVLVSYYNKTFQVSTPLNGYEIRVYIRAEDAPFHFDDVRVGLDGIFMFQNLNPGNYEVFVFTEDRYTEVLSPVIKTITITNKGSIVTIDEPFSILIHV